jgi:hypothetical protein
MFVSRLASAGRHRWILLLCLFLLLSGCSGRPDYSDVKVQQSPAGGLTSSSFDSHYLHKRVEETRNAAEQRLVSAYERNNIPKVERYSHAQAEGRYEQLDGRRLLVIDLSYSANPMQVMRIAGIVQDQLIAISCISPQGEPLEFSSGESHCAEVYRYYFRPGE